MLSSSGLLRSWNYPIYRTYTNKSPREKRERQQLLFLVDHQNFPGFNNPRFKRNALYQYVTHRLYDAGLFISINNYQFQQFQAKENAFAM